MSDNNLQDFARLIGSVSLPQAEKDRITDFLIKKANTKRRFKKRYIAASASAVAVLAVSTVLLAREVK